MIVPTLMGGLGNTLFQIAAAIGQAELTRNEWKIPASWKYREYFSIPDEKYIDSHELPRYKELNFHYSPIPKFDNLELFGYFQSELYFKHCERKIRMYFRNRFPVSEIPEGAGAIHIRGGDYLNLSEYHYNLEPEYYHAAIGQSGLELFYVFTDDKPHAQKILKGINRQFVYFDSLAKSKEANDVYDLFQMSKFPVIIMANSSYSWWAQWLNPNMNKVVYAPPKWFGEKKSHYITDDLYCDNWEVVNY